MDGIYKPSSYTERDECACFHNEHESNDHKRNFFQLSVSIPLLRIDSTLAVAATAMGMIGVQFLNISIA